MVVFKRKETNEIYLQIRRGILQKAIEQVTDRGTNFFNDEVRAINKAYTLFERRESPDYQATSQFILANYPAELGFYATKHFANLFDQRLSQNHFENIIKAMQLICSPSYIQPQIDLAGILEEYPLFYAYLNKYSCQERAENVLDFLTIFVFNPEDVYQARKEFGRLFNSDGIKEPVKERLFDLDESVGKYITGRWFF